MKTPKPFHSLFFLLGLTPISACATAPGAAEIPGLESFQARCAGEPAALSDQEALALSAHVEAAIAQPNQTQAARDAIAARLNANVIAPLAQRDQRLRAYGLCERARADGAVALIGRHNQIVR